MPADGGEGCRCGRSNRTATAVLMQALDVATMAEVDAYEVVAARGQEPTRATA